MVKELVAKLATGREQKATMAVMCKKNPELKGPLKEMEGILQELGKFTESANETLASVAAEFSSDSAKDEIKKMQEKVMALTRLAETRKIGFQVAKKKWDALLG